jgi:hypothetical protein
MALVLLAATLATAGTHEIDMQLRIQPELDLKGTERVYVGPVVLEPRDQADYRQVDINAVREFERYIRKILHRRTRLTMIDEVPDLSPPTEDLNQLMEMRDFWATLGTETQADYIVAASVDVEVRDREGYKTEKYVSPEDGKTYYRQALIEETGFSYDILILVFDGQGGLVHEEQITDFKDRNENKLDSFKDMFNDLFTLENRILGIFVPRTVRAKRYLYSG